MKNKRTSKLAPHFLSGPFTLKYDATCLTSKVAHSFSFKLNVLN